MNVFPSLKGIKWPVSISPIWNNDVQKTVTGRRVASTYQQYPLFAIKVEFEFLDESDFNTLMGFINTQGGTLTGFYFDAGSGQNSVTTQAFGTGDGTTTTFTLLRSYGGQVEPVGGVNGSPEIYVAGTLQASSGYTISGNQITFNTAPANGDVLTWTGNYYFQCAFSKGNMEIQQFASLLWMTKTLQMETYN